MRHNSDNRDLVIVDEDITPSSLMRWLPTMVVMSVVVGFISLAWYAYHVGMQSLKDEDLIVVEADHAPIKEKPVDPGGMKFPNQDKTVFETFSGNNAPPKVERVLPTPEEPMNKAEVANTSGFVNEKQPAKTPANKPAKPEQVIGKKELAAADSDTESYVAESAKAAAAAAQVKPAAAAEKPVEKPVEKTDKKGDKKAPGAAEKSEKPTKKEAKKEAAPAAATDDDSDEAPAKSHKIAVQLGAYRSEKEAQDAWDKMQNKNSALANEVPMIVKANLGSKGVYYRLRLNDFASSSDAQGLCKKLAAHGQACVVAP